MVEIILERIPKHPDPSAHYLFYLHGLIVEIGGRRPYSDEHGYYEYERIVKALAAEGFTVISEVRDKGTEVLPYAESVARQIETLIEAGVEPERIVVMGASKGGVIGARISDILANERLNFVFLAGLFEKYLDTGVCLCGNILSIHDRSDTFAMAPDAYFERSAGRGTFEKMVLDMGLGHGVIYRPYDQWLAPFRDWYSRR